MLSNSLKMTKVLQNMPKLWKIVWKKYIILTLVHLLVLLCEFHFSVNKSPPLVPKQSYINPVHAFPFYFLKIRFNIILPSTLISSK
jgi:hypothetical protein